MNKPQNGFAHQLLVLLILVAGVVGVAGWAVMQQNEKAAESTSTKSEQAIQNKSDLQEELNKLNSAAVDNDLDPSQLDEDLQSLL